MTSDHFVWCIGMCAGTTLYSADPVDLGAQSNLIGALEPVSVGRISAAQIESSLLLLSRIWSGFLRCGFGWAWLAGLGSGS